MFQGVCGRRASPKIGEKYHIGAKRIQGGGAKEKTAHHQKKLSKKKTKNRLRYAKNKHFRVIYLLRKKLDQLDIFNYKSDQ